MSEFRSVIEWFDDTGEAIVHRYPEQGSADIKFGSQTRLTGSPSPDSFTPGLPPAKRSSQGTVSMPDPRLLWIPFSRRGNFLFDPIVGSNLFANLLH